MLYCYDRLGARSHVVRDRLGRLLLYYTSGPRGALVSRDQALPLGHDGAVEIDRLALGQLLLLGYSLESRTLVRSHRRLLPGQSLEIGSGGLTLGAPRTPFAPAPDASAAISLPTLVGGLAEALVAACRDRAGDAERGVLSLSGGMDSQTVAAGLRAAGARYSAATFIAPGSAHRDESAQAEEVARRLRVRWAAHRVPAQGGAAVEEIIERKLGLSPIDQAFGLSYLRTLRGRDSGRIALWTGEGGDKLLPDHRSLPARAAADALVDFIIRKNAIWSSAAIGALIDVHPDDLASSLHASITRFSELREEDRYSHFLLWSRAGRWLFEGEERNRLVVWPLSPFYAIEFVSQAMAAPRRYKAGRKLYRALLRHLEPGLAALLRRPLDSIGCNTVSGIGCDTTASRRSRCGSRATWRVGARATQGLPSGAASCWSPPARAPSRRPSIPIECEPSCRSATPTDRPRFRCCAPPFWPSHGYAATSRRAGGRATAAPSSPPPDRRPPGPEAPKPRSPAPPNLRYAPNGVPASTILSSPGGAMRRAAFFIRFCGALVAAGALSIAQAAEVSVTNIGAIGAGSNLSAPLSFTTGAEAFVGWCA